MKRPLQLPLAIALALGGTNAFALGLGTIHVNSKLNQPLDAEIPVLQGTQGEAEGLLVQLAAAEDFDRVGLNRSRLSVPLEFSLVKSAHGEMVIKVTSKEVVREPFLDFLVEANWPKGRLLREYTVLLDPPIMAPATATTAVTQAAKAPPERAPSQPLPEKPKAAPPAPKPAPIAAAPRPEKPAPAPKAAPAAPATKAAVNGEYTVEPGDTLSAIAREVKPEDSTNINQLMLALLKQNPNAFYKENINALKRGAILRIPSADQIKSVGSAGEAAAMVHSQIEDWRGGAAAKPTLVADTGAAPEPKAKPPATKPSGTSSTASTTPKSGSEHLALVPPKAGKDSIAMNDRPGSGAGSGNAASGEVKAELARTKEALASREQESGELKSRVKELEDTKSKSDRLITLKDSEIADLQKKLKELQDQGKNGAKTTTSATTTSATPPTTATSTPPATTATTPSTAGKTDNKVSKEDIWGTAGTAPENKAPAATATPPATGTGSTTSTTTPSTTTSPAGTAGSTTPSTPTGSSTASTTPATGSTTPSATSPSTSPTSTPPSASTSTTPSSTGTTPSVTAPSSTLTPSTSPTASTPAKPAATTAPVKTVKTTTQPLPSSTPTWYEQAWVKPAAIGAAALLLLAGLLSMRRRKAAAAMAERASIAGAFGESPLREDGGDTDVAMAGEEQALREQLEHDPGNLGLHLELLSLLYAERAVTAFEDAAETMHMHVTDQHQPEWLEARAMGQELAPHNGLFADGMASIPEFDDEAITAPHATATSFDHDEVFKPQYEPMTPPPAHANTAFDFDLDAGEPAPKPTATTAAEPPFAFDNLPPIDFGKETQHEIEAASAPPPLHVDEDEFVGEDGVGTKLDLAKAYLDMGDPEGARSMLEEVLSEGNDSQKGEARRLMAEIR